MVLDSGVDHKSFGSDPLLSVRILGDSVLNLGVSDLLYARFDRCDEGELTGSERIWFARTLLHKLAVSLGLLCCGSSERQGQGAGAQHPSILADALRGRHWCGLSRCRLPVGPSVGQTAYLSLWWPKPPWKADKDAKTALQEWLQGAQDGSATIAVPKDPRQSTWQFCGGWMSRCC